MSARCSWGEYLSFVAMFVVSRWMIPLIEKIFVEYLRAKFFTNVLASVVVLRVVDWTFSKVAHLVSKILAV